MTDQDRARWTKLVADYEASDLTQHEFASERGVSFSNLGRTTNRRGRFARSPWRREKQEVTSAADLRG